MYYPNRPNVLTHTDPMTGSQRLVADLELQRWIRRGREMGNREDANWLPSLLHP
jgi:hypothetical protein